MPDNVQLGRIEERVGNIDKKVDRLCLLLEGDGSDDRPGLVKDVDRIKQVEGRRKAIIGAIFTGTIGLVAERVFAFFKA